MNIENIKTPPTSLESEQSVLGGLLLDNLAWDEVADTLCKEDFYQSKHQLIFSSIAYLLEHDQNPQFAVMQDGLWWAFVTLTTVGYGDIVPITPGGRIVAVITMIFGIVVMVLELTNIFILIYKMLVVSSLPWQ